MVAPEPGSRADAIQQRHVQVEHDRVGVEPVGELDCLEPVRRRADHAQIGLVVDQLAKGVEEAGVVIGDQDANARMLRRGVFHH